jgi:hypothetical protein
MNPLRLGHTASSVHRHTSCCPIESYHTLLSEDTYEGYHTQTPVSVVHGSYLLYWNHNTGGNNIMPNKHLEHHNKDNEQYHPVAR